MKAKNYRRKKCLYGNKKNCETIRAYQITEQEVSLGRMTASVKLLCTAVFGEVVNKYM